MERRSFSVGGFVIRFRRCLNLSIPRVVHSPSRWEGRQILDADKAAEVSWLRENVMGPGQSIWGLPITARDRPSDRMLGLGRTFGYRNERRCRSFWKLLARCHDARGSQGRPERYACVEAPRGSLGHHRSMTVKSADLITLTPRSHLRGMVNLVAQRANPAALRSGGQTWSHQ
jgi:hypothetical protein